MAHKPVMTAEQTNIPQNEEELQAATEKRLAAEKVEQEAHEVARGGRKVVPEAEEEAFFAAQNVQEALYEMARAQGPAAFRAYGTSVCFAAAIMAKSMTGGLQATINFITSEYERISTIDAEKQAATDAANQPKH